MDNLDLKTVALKMARDINPDKGGQNGYQSLMQDKTPPSVDKILTDAKTIYAWLIEE